MTTPVPAKTLRVRWLGKVSYDEALCLQNSISRNSNDDYLLLLEHPHVFTVGRSAAAGSVPAGKFLAGAEVVNTSRGGGVTYHGPGQLVAYPLFSVSSRPGSVPAFVRSLEEVVIRTLRLLGIEGGTRSDGRPGVWVPLENNGVQKPGAMGKICSLGVRFSRHRTTHGIALNVCPDMGYFDRIVPCGIPDVKMVSMRDLGFKGPMSEVVEAIAAETSEVFGYEGVDFASVSKGKSGSVEEPDKGQFEEGGAGGGEGVSVQLRSRLVSSGVDVSSAMNIAQRKPEWLRSNFKTEPGYLGLKRQMRSLDLVTVCEEAGCPNIYECWADGTATFMVNGERCTRACGFCQIDTSKPLPVKADEPDRVAKAVLSMGLDYAVVTTVARDDLSDGGASTVASTIAAIRKSSPNTKVEVLISDCRGRDEDLETIFSARPDVLNHNLETVARLQRAVRPSAGYARSLAVLARASDHGLVAKSGVMVGLGETTEELYQALADLRAVGTEIVTVGQYLRPSLKHIPVARFVSPEEFEQIEAFGYGLGFSHVEASPLTRSSFHAKRAFASAGVPGALTEVGAQS